MHILAVGFLYILHGNHVCYLTCIAVKTRSTNWTLFVFFFLIAELSIVLVILFNNFCFCVVCVFEIYLSVGLSSISFSYSGATGPEKWGSLSPNFSACSNGKIQSPVDIVKGILTPSKRLKPLTRVYGASNATLFNNGFNIGVCSSTSSTHWHYAPFHVLLLVTQIVCLVRTYFNFTFWWDGLAHKEFIK